MAMFMPVNVPGELGGIAVDVSMILLGIVNILQVSGAW
jgi:hypothetical protein